MDDYLTIIKKAGLNDAQASVYLALVQNGKLTPTELAEITGEKRENCYNLTKRLEELNLVEKTNDHKTTYRALNPSSLETLAEKRRKIVQKNEQFLKQNISSLITAFYANNEMPGSRTLEGMDGIKEAYQDILRVKKDVYLLRTQADKLAGNDDQPKSILHEYRKKLPTLGIHTYALTPDNATARRHAKNGRDKEVNFHRTVFPVDAYTAPVEVHAYGSKVAFISFGETQMTVIIDSIPIAESFRQIHKIMTEYYRSSYPQISEE